MANVDDTRDPTGRLIAAQRVAGTVVYDPEGTRLGSVIDVVIDKRSGNVAYAVLSFGGFLGVGNRHYPLPWAKLSYNSELSGYVVDIDRSTLEGAPAYDDQEAMFWNDAAWGRRIHDYYQMRASGDIVT